MNIYRVIVSEERTVTYEVKANSIEEAEKKIFKNEAEEVDSEWGDMDIVDYDVIHRGEQDAGFATNDTPTEGKGLF